MSTDGPRLTFIKKLAICFFVDFTVDTMPSLISKSRRNNDDAVSSMSNAYLAKASNKAIVDKSAPDLPCVPTRKPKVSKVRPLIKIDHDDFECEDETVAANRYNHTVNNNKVTKNVEKRMKQIENDPALRDIVECLKDLVANTQGMSIPRWESLLCKLLICPVEKMVEYLIRQVNESGKIVSSLISENDKYKSKVGNFKQAAIDRVLRHVVLDDEDNFVKGNDVSSDVSYNLARARKWISESQEMAREALIAMSHTPFEQGDNEEEDDNVSTVSNMSEREIRDLNAKLEALTKENTRLQQISQRR